MGNSLIKGYDIEKDPIAVGISFLNIMIRKIYK
jgi:hypothetical protein